MEVISPSSSPASTATIAISASWMGRMRGALVLSGPNGCCDRYLHRGVREHELGGRPPQCHVPWSAACPEDSLGRCQVDLVDAFLLFPLKRTIGALAPPHLARLAGT
jgi:hypothetical protein